MLRILVRIQWLEGEILEIQERLETITEEGTIYPTQKDGNVKWYVWKTAEESIYQRKMIKKSKILSIKISGALSEGHNK